MTHVETLENVKRAILDDIANRVNIARSHEIRVTIYASKKTFRFLNGKLVIEDSHGFHEPTDLYSWEELAEIADRL